MSKKRNLRSYKILAIIILIAAAMLACGIGGQATQAPQAQPPEEPQAQVPPEGAAAPIEQDASSQAGGSGILFKDDFQDGQPDNWQITSSWYVQQLGISITSVPQEEVAPGYPLVTIGVIMLSIPMLC